nr:MAG TPA: hypothetical protein [Caudoviricetes sp.]
MITVLLLQLIQPNYGYLWRRSLMLLSVSQNWHLEVSI